MADVLERVRRVVRKELRLDELPAASARLEEDLEGDSLDMVELVMAVEEEFGVELNDEAVDAAYRAGWTVQALADLVESQRKVRQ